MSGLLQRLAWRALGLPPAIRPIMGRKRAAEPTDPIPRTAQAAETDAPQPGLAEAASAAAIGAASDAIGPHRAERMSEMVPAPGQPSALPLPSSAALIPGAVVANSVQPQPAAVAAVHEVAGFSADHTIDPANTALATLQTPSDDVAGTAQTGSPAADGDQAHAHLRHPPLPRRAPASARPASADTPPGAGRSRTVGTDPLAQEEVTEVHVTIGRIELNAVQAPAAPRRKPSKAREPQSLDAYLARREANSR